jgi:hypothetical protein
METNKVNEWMTKQANKCEWNKWIIERALSN